jgi:glycosyltransferase involved in cell wall biosynthesis
MRRDLRIAFYAPMKAPDHPRSSGDRTMARLLMTALSMSGHAAEPVCRLSSFDGVGDAARQQRIGAVGDKLAERLVRRWRRGPPAERPDLWFTYHLYHKAPDWLGPRVTLALDIPYVVAEASHAGKQAQGPWALAHAAAADAISRADLIVGLNAADTDGVRPLLADPARLLALRPFVDTRPYVEASAARDARRRSSCERHGIAAGEPILLTVAMMRAGDKLASYRLMGEALGSLRGRRWRLLIAGDGPAHADVRQALASFADRIVWLGHVDEAEMPRVYASADLYVWPAIGEAWGMTLLEAQAAGLPVVAGRNGGIPDIVADGETGILAPVADARAFALAVAALLDDATRRRAMGDVAQVRMLARHDIAIASRTMDAALQRLIRTRRCA